MSSAGSKTARAASSRPLISPRFLAGHRRQRLFLALAEVTAEQGYEGTSISDVVRRAAVARKTLYDNFGGKEELLLDATRDSIAAVLDRVEAACAAEDEWPARIGAGLDALLAEVAEAPARAHLLIVTAQAATPASARLYEEALTRFQVLLREATPEDAVPEPVVESLVGGIAWILHCQLRAGEGERAPELLPDLSEFVLAAYRQEA
jgi:TetR/AcrR family transcriptional repressor of lmrAB and yxaGH operons